jgi:predicted ATPase
MHLKKVQLHHENYPSKKLYPFNLDIFSSTGSVAFSSNITFFIGENGTGKSTLLRAIARSCGIHIWQEAERRRFNNNRYEDQLCRYIDVEWASGPVPGSFFAADIFNHFARMLDEWAAADPEILKYFGSESLVSKSHGQSHMAFFKNRFRIKGLYLLDEPENALSPGMQIELIKTLGGIIRSGEAQFIIATHSPILLACPGAEIFSFDTAPIKKVEYEETDYFKIYRDFMNEREKFL